MSHHSLIASYPRAEIGPNHVKTTHDVLEIGPKMLKSRQLGRVIAHEFGRMVAM